MPRFSPQLHTVGSQNKSCAVAWTLLCRLLGIWNGQWKQIVSTLMFHRHLLLARGLSLFSVPRRDHTQASSTAHSALASVCDSTEFLLPTSLTAPFLITLCQPVVMVWGVQFPNAQTPLAYFLISLSPS